MHLMIAVLLAAAPGPGSASAAVQKTTDQVKKSIKSWFKADGKAREKARDEARSAVGALIDFETFSQATLGKKWEEQKPADRKRYTAALKGAMEANYLARMRQGKSEDVDNVKTEILSEEPQGEKTLVKTKVTSGADTASIDYLMEKQKSGWHAVDVITEGASLAETYREQVNKLLPKKGFDGVIAAFDKKKKSLEEQQ